MFDSHNGGSTWLRRYHSSQADLRLVCLPHAGGSASFYHPVSRALSPVADVLAVQYPGRQDRHAEPGIGDLQRLADEVAEVLRPLTDLPLVLFGHSMGALLGYEVALRLERSGTRPQILFASGRRAPSRYRQENVHGYDDARLIAELRKLGGTDSRLLDEPDVTRMLLPAIRSDYRAVEIYRSRPEDRLSCPVVVLTGESDPQVTPEEAQAWQDHTSGPFELVTYPGGHFFLVDQASAVIEAISTRIIKADREGTGRHQEAAW